MPNEDDFAVAEPASETPMPRLPSSTTEIRAVPGTFEEEERANALDLADQIELDMAGAARIPAHNEQYVVGTYSRKVWLHIYDLGPVTRNLNDYILTEASLGAFHCGVEVLGDEWAFQGFHDAWDDDTISGVVRNEPRSHPGYEFRDSICLGDSPLDEDEIDTVIDEFMDSWPANGYHLVARTCVTFAEEFSKALYCPEPFPEWVKGAADAGKQPLVFAIADYGWSWFKWWSQRQMALEAEALAAERAAEAEARKKRLEENRAGQEIDDGFAVAPAASVCWTWVPVASV
jgi:hypothetical protein